MTTYEQHKAVKILRDNGLVNAATAFNTAARVGLDLAAAAALLQKETGGKNEYGHDAGGALSGFPLLVNEDNWNVFWWLVNDQGHTSNGVGPVQITFKGFFQQMLDQGKRPWVASDNMEEGFGALKGYHDACVKAGSKHPWVDAGTRYNGDHDYGLDLAAKNAHWVTLLRPARTP